MKAEAKSLRFLGEGKKLTVPFFQRHYVWTEENWKELLDSFLSVDVLPFLGSIILKDASSFAGSEAIIIDGQQRLTTITILAKAIYDCLPVESKGAGSGIRRDIESFLFYRVNSSDDFIKSKVKIEHSRIDNADYSKVISSGGLLNEEVIDCTTIGDGDSNILKCYQYYYNILKDKTVEELKHLHDSMFGEERKVFVLIALEHQDINEQSIFDTINRAGVRLTSADIIKNNLFKLCLDKCSEVHKDRDDVCELYDNQWDSLFYADNNDRDLWDAKRIFGNVQHTNLEFLLYCVATIKWGKNEDIFSNLEKVYMDNTAGCSYGQIEALIKEINEYGKIFKTKVLDLHKALNSDDNNLYFKFDEHIDRLLLILDKFGVQMFYPYVLKRLKDVDGNFQDEELIHDFGVLESFVVRRRLSGKGVTDYAIKCNQILRSENGIKQLIISDLANSDAGITNRDIKQYITKVNNDTAKMILFCIELHRRKNPMYDVVALPYYFTLEHIMPTKWEKYWIDVPVYDSEGNVFEGEPDEKKTLRNSYIQNLGNMILLTTKLNTAVSNNAFDIKVKGINENKPGYKAYSFMLLTKEIVSAYEDGDTEWDERHIQQRAINLWNEIITIWPDYAEEAPQQESPVEAEDTLVIEDVLTVDDFSEEALSDPLKMLEEFDQKAASKVPKEHQLFIVKKDITKMDCDTIVNAANSGLKQGKGVCGAIFAEAGAHRLQKACDAVGYCAEGKAVITSGFDLKAKNIIHTVGPRWNGGNNHERDILYSCYVESLHIAEDNNCKSIAFPLISAGIFGYPTEEAFEVAISAIEEYPYQSDMQVFLTVLEDDMLEIGNNVLKAYLDSKKVNVVNGNDYPEEIAGMITQAEFIRQVNVQSETIESYVRTGKIKPDLIMTLGQSRNIKYYSEKTVAQYVQQFGWTFINDGNRWDMFMEMIRQMDMSYSYKPVFIKAILEYADEVGNVRMSDIVDYFLSFYADRREEGKIIERANSAFAKNNCTKKDAEHIILIYPFKRFEQRGMMSYDKETELITIDSVIMTNMSEDKKREILLICDEKLSQYYSKLESKDISK
ncbi:MAG: macro domain-containing protein [Caulobacteraceae bacterium]